MPKLGPDHLLSLFLEPTGSPATDVQAWMTLRRIRVSKPQGWNMVKLTFGGQNFEIEMSRSLAEKLRDDLTRWLKANRKQTEADWRRLAGGK